MSDAPDPLERELSALRPRAVSPELRRRVGNRLGARRRWAWALALAGVLAAAFVVVLIAPRKKEPLPPAPPAVVPPAPPAPAEPESPAPTVWTFHRALARSPEDLDALLDRQRANPDPEPVPAAWTRSPAALDALLGDD
jgi:hypothetical protein